MCQQECFLGVSTGVESYAFDSWAQLRRSRTSGHPKGRSEAEEPSGLTTRLAEAIPVQNSESFL